MRILILFSQPWKVGGAETHVLDLLKVLRAHGHQAYIATNGTDDAPVQPLEGLTERQWKWNFRSANPLEFRRISRKLRGIVDEYQIDIIHVTSSERMKPPKVWSVTSPPEILNTAKKARM